MDDLYIIYLTLEVKQDNGFYTTLENCAIDETEDKSESQLLFNRLLAELEQLVESHAP